MTSELRFYIALFMRHFHWFAVIFVLVGALSALMATRLPDSFESEAILVVEDERIPGDLAASTFRTQAGEQLQIIQRRVLTRGTLLDLAARLDVYGRGKNNTPGNLTSDQIVSDLRERIRIKISGVSGRGPAQAAIVTISFTASTPQLAADVTNEITKLIQAEDLSMRMISSQRTLSFFEDNVAALKSDLEAAEAALLRFQTEHADTLPDSLEFRRGLLVAAQDRLQALEDQSAELSEQLKRSSENTGFRDRPGDGRFLVTAQDELQQLHIERQQLLAILSPQNPRIRILDQRIASFENGFAARMPEQESSPREQSAYLAGDTLEEELRRLQSRQEDVRAEIARLDASIATTPVHGLTLAALERDRASLQGQYENALAKRATAAIGESIEKHSDGQRISLIEAASPPLHPQGPNRIAIAGLGLALGSVLGVVVAFLASALKPGIRRPTDLTEGLGIAAFATLPYVPTPAELSRKRVLRTGSAVAFVLLAIGFWAALAHGRSPEPRLAQTEIAPIWSVRADLTEPTWTR